MTFAAPHLLWLLILLLPALIAFFWWSWRIRQRLMAQFIHARLLPGLTVGISSSRRKLRLACLILAVVCLVLTLARPQWGFDWEEARVRGLDIVVAIDTSKSMLAEDIAPNRLERAKLAALDLMQQAKSDRLGLIAFAGSAFLQCPLTIDDSAFRQSVQMLDVNTIPQGGTALAEAIDTALTAFKEGENHKVLVLFTDGEDHDSEPLEAAKRASEAGLKIYTIGIGTPEGEILRIKNAQGQSDYVRDDQGNAVKSHLDEDLLRKIASATEGGFYLPLRGAKTIDTLYTQGLAKLPKSEHEQKLIKQYRERYHWPLAAAIALLLTEAFLPERKRESRPRRAAVAAAATASATLLLLCPASLLGSPAGALRDYKAGRYDESQKEYEQLLQRKADDPRLHFNTGAAAYRNRQFEAATKQFDEALNSPDLKLQSSAYYNRGNSLFYLGEQDPDPAKRSETWKKSLQDFESSAKLNPQDPDAKFNYEFVKKKLEELKQQPQDQKNKPDQKPNQDQDKDQDKQSQQQNQKDQKDQKDQQKQDQQKQQDQQNQQNKDQAKQDEPKQDQAGQQGQQKPEPKPEPSAQPKPSTGQAGQTNDQDQAEAEAAANGEMTPQQAQQLLDAQKAEETMMPANPNNNNKPLDRSRPIKDW